MKTVKIGNLEIGKGIPKICVPIMGRQKEILMEEAKEAVQAKADIVEWRADYFEKAEDIHEILNTLCELKQELGTLPLLFTFRTKQEGGEKEIDRERYLELNRAVICSGKADLVDLELFLSEAWIKELKKEAEKAKVRILVSNHDFEKTPGKEEIIRRLEKMQQLGADIAKIAVMPRKKDDVKALLDATWEMKDRNTPVVTMSMGKMGVLSRVSGSFYGSCITFGCIGKVSAPGQIEISELQKMLNVL